MQVLAGVALAIAISAVAYKLLLARFGRQGLLVVSQGVLGLVAAGLVMFVLRTVAEEGWLAIGSSSFIELGWLSDPRAGVLRTVAAVIGIHSTLSLAECVGWLAYVSFASAMIFRDWRTSIVVRWRQAQPL
jgi:hypothetical protein